MSQRERDAEQLRLRAVGQLCARLELPLEGEHLEEALTHSSFANELRYGTGCDNQRLEFLGDAVLGLCVSELLMDRFESVDEGELTMMRAALVNAAALAAFAYEIDLAAALRLGRGAEAAGERQRANVQADALEALVGAVFLDHGLERARALCGAIVADKLATLVAQGGIDRDPKSRLQERLQACGRPAPCYRVVATEGPDHDRRFTVEADVESAEGSWRVLGSGRGRSKKLAEQAAARAGLAALDEGEIGDG